MLRSLQKKTKAQVFAGPGPSRKAVTVGKSWVAFSRRLVNLSNLYFHLLPLAGCFLAGGWCDRLTLWCPLLDMAAKVLRDVVWGRI